MSGGSYNYISSADTEEEALEKSEDLRRLVEFLEKDAPGHPVTRWSRSLLDTAYNQPQVPPPVRDVWHALEWWHSADWSEEQYRKALEECDQPLPAPRFGVKTTGKIHSDWKVRYEHLHAMAQRVAGSVVGVARQRADAVLETERMRESLEEFQAGYRNQQRSHQAQIDALVRDKAKQSRELQAATDLAARLIFERGGDYHVSDVDLVDPQALLLTTWRDPVTFTQQYRVIDVSEPEDSNDDD